MPGFTEIPTETDGSLGRNKSDIDAVPNYEQFVPAAEWNTIKSTVAILAERLGLNDGSQAGTIEEFLVAVAADPIHGLDSGRYQLAEDFQFDSGAFVFSLPPTWNAASVATIALGEQANSNEFIGDPYEKSVVMNIRIKLNSAAGDVSFRFDDTGKSDDISFRKGTSSGWLIRVDSTRSGGTLTTNFDNVGTYTTNWTVLTVSFEYAQSRLRILQDGNVLATISTLNNIPDVGSYGVELASLTTAFDVDYCYVEGDR